MLHKFNIRNYKINLFKRVCRLDPLHTKRIYLITALRMIVPLIFVGPPLF